MLRACRHRRFVPAASILKTLILMLVVADDESLDYDSTKLFSGGINPAALPYQLVNGKCSPLYPHNRVRVNTAFEVIQAKGGVTAYTDK